MGVSRGKGISGRTWELEGEMGIVGVSRRKWGLMGLPGGYRS